MSIDEQAFAVASDSRRAAGLAGAAPAVEVERLVKRYGEKVAVAGISFTVARGEVFGLLGPNGAGKTTTIEIITGLRQPDAGRVRVLGLEHGRHAAAIKERIGVHCRRRRCSRCSRSTRCSISSRGSSATPPRLPR